MTATRPVFLAAVAAALLAACQSYSPGGFPPGATAIEVRNSMGVPTGTYPLPDGGVRYEYARGPWGKHTYMIDFDAQARLVKSEQVLTENNFAKIRPGQTRDQVLFAIGHPSDVKQVRYQNQTVWSYRYDAIFCIWFQVSLSPEGQVLEVGNGPDPLCDRNDERP
jgi:hypothetical protein